MTFQRHSIDGFEWNAHALELAAPVPPPPVSVTIWASPESRIALPPSPQASPAVPRRPIIIRILARLMRILLAR